MLNFYDKVIVNWPIFFQNWQEQVFYFKVASVIISVALLIIIIYLIILIRRDIEKSFATIVESVEAPNLPKKKITKQWEGVLQKLEGEDESSYKMAVIEGDKILDELLQRIGYKGADMSARLKQLTPAQTPNINELWQAHKVRNRIAHEPNFHLTREMARRAVSAYQHAFEDLELL